jgi:hypothetical protein
MNRERTERTSNVQRRTPSIEPKHWFDVGSWTFDVPASTDLNHVTLDFAAALAPNCLA